MTTTHTSADAALGQHEQEAMRRRCGIDIIEWDVTPGLLTFYAVTQDGRLVEDDLTWDDAEQFAYDLAAQLVADEAVGDLS